MPKRNNISEEQVIEIEKVKKKNKDKNIDRRLAVLLLHAKGKSRSEISEQTGYGKQYITELVCRYLRNGLKEYASKHYAGNHRNLSFAEETTLLDGFKKEVEAGQVVEVSDILAAYEKELGRPVGSNSQIYYVLHRHGWRKVMPRSKHQNKASAEAIEASKKLT